MDKRRPVLVLSTDARNERASDVIIVPGTSRVRESLTHVVLRAAESGLSARTSLQGEQVTTLLQSDIEPKPIGQLTPQKLAAVERAVMRAIGVRAPEPD
jgi:mRNA-degrading endonuclease toxin of MazEF toxin-antitoxin module